MPAPAAAMPPRACACGGGCPRCTAPLAPADAPEESRAERLAQRVMADAPQPAASPAQPPAGEASLPAALRAFYEPRFGRSLGGITLHTGAAAQREAAGSSAHAFTHRRRIVLGADRPALPSTTLAHELAHALHDDPQTIWREPYETRGIDLDRPATADQPSGRAQIATLGTRSYWEQRTIDRYELVTDTALTGELLDAALSVLWSLNPPATVRSRQLMLVPVAARTIPAPAAAPGSTAPPQAPTTTPEMVCRCTFDPPAGRGGKPRLEVMRAASGTGMGPVAAPAAPVGFAPAMPRSFTFRGFATTADDYYAAHPAEHQALFHWIENSAPASFSQLVTTTTEVAQRGGGTRVTHRSAFHVSGSHNGSDIASLSTTLVGQAEVMAQQSAPAGYRGHGAAIDFEIEKLQGRASDALGSITLPASIPADEVVPVREAVRQYFSAGNARNTEVDAIVPVGSGSRSVLYTLVFGAGNAVTVRRIGEAGSGTGRVELNRLDVRRVRGFPSGAGATPVQLRSWWSTRYPQGGALPADATLAADALAAEMNALLAAGVANANWFANNYGIEVLDAAGTTARLRTVHNVPQAQAGGTVDFDATDLRMLELALQTLSTSELSRLRGVKLGRRTASLTRTRRGFAAGSATQYGVTFTEASGETTVLYFAPLYANNTRLFRGGSAAGALPEATMNLLHELGHATEARAGIEAAFNAWLAANPQSAPTWYAASGAAEMFPEAWALYHTDTSFLCGSAPLLYAWLDELARTGTPPAAGAALTAPSSCPP
ncbi:MAG TPA: DUF4157 domain-containing protein [Rubrivivax sp.]|nr:DUF4157 domain-containing protein [Rubrivivax sp.]